MRPTHAAGTLTTLLLGLTLLPSAPAAAHEGIGDQATNTRAAQVATRRRRHVREAQAFAARASSWSIHWSGPKIS